uniref:Ribosomal protein S14 n=1 Tax=Eukaryota sp. BB2 TaxID=1949062 RepID=A0A1W5QGC0_9EUKA|nr:ribosomal protein S14 [Eukaryota sp. BB2]AQL10435.1 ribosomal protein S14 [Eukaryota sp. BB2]
MASKAIRSKNYNKRATFVQSEKKHLFFTILKQNNNLPLAVRRQLFIKANACPRTLSFVHNSNRCIITGRAHGVYRKLKVSRIKLKEFVGKGILPGIRKSSW